MKKKTVTTVGCYIPGNVAEELGFRSSESLLDSDVIVFSPNFSGYESSKQFAGKRLLHESHSIEVKERTAHWSREMTLALQHGNTVFIILRTLEDFYVHTGQQTFSGTGRSTRTTDIVEHYHPYSVIPVSGFSASIMMSTGDKIKPTKNLGVLASLWQEFGRYMYYEAYLNQPSGIPALVTKTGDKMVAGIVRFKGWTGNLIVLPMIDFESMASERRKTSSKQDAGKILNVARLSVGKQFVASLIEIDKAVRVSMERTPAPTWVSADEYCLEGETAAKLKISEIEDEIARLEGARLQAVAALEGAANLKNLLFETGTPLESAILEALQLMGFTANNYKDATSEFDVVFVDPNGDRLLGEAEGKNDKAVNIDKLDQLNRNIEEEFAKRNDPRYSKAVLFGNAFRLSSVEGRQAFFTEKCIAGSKRIGAALVRTPDLFPIAKYLKSNSDPEFAKTCRHAILNTSGTIVVFPDVPKSKTIPTH